MRLCSWVGDRAGEGEDDTTIVLVGGGTSTLGWVDFDTGSSVVSSRARFFCAVGLSGGFVLASGLLMASLPAPFAFDDCSRTSGSSILAYSWKCPGAFLSRLVGRVDGLFEEVADDEVF